MITLLNIEDDDGRTPINNASSNGKLEVVKYLYKTCHANVEAKDKMIIYVINV